VISTNVILIQLRCCCSSYLWQEQITGVLNSGVGRVDHIVCTHRLVEMFNTAINHVNKRRQPSEPKMPTMRKGHKRNSGQHNSHTLDDFKCGPVPCSQMVCEDSNYKIDCLHIPCRDQTIP
jgi:hypothetical protein